ncbi:hypothetical protein HRM2_43610 [Desulforapulum autotrophicum HRM2]|uniref:Uncharacterized protein n=1 Tax=Desulforapulum autotrophicum (strain ATCC 43914 / DSM 3382 / VKM B-1955 / HRM2) TaxID=177437 RepID=C0QDZ6_DESAH|nr:hypothetical protein HRM2_43610 [Desulforapulum autotrophicum HRM2]
MGCFLSSFLPPSHRPLPRAFALTLPFSMTVFRPLTFWPSTIFIWHINDLLPVCKRHFHCRQLFDVQCKKMLSAIYSFLTYTSPQSNVNGILRLFRYFLSLNKYHFWLFDHQVMVYWRHAKKSLLLILKMDIISSSWPQTLSLWEYVNSSIF